MAESELAEVVEACRAGRGGRAVVRQLAREVLSRSGGRRWPCPVPEVVERGRGGRARSRRSSPYAEPSRARAVAEAVEQAERGRAR